MCCMKRMEKISCEFGLVRKPVKSCSSFEECNSDGKGTLTNQWCDYKGHHCCKDDGNKLWACPDRVTPLFNEPICNGYIQSDINSGSCPQDSGICKNGHCCPPLKNNDTNETIIGQKPYITNYTCKPEEALPPQFKQAFCDPEKKKIVIMGEKDVNGDATVNEGTKCDSNKDCEDVNVCVTEISGEHHCFVNPLLVKKEESSQFWKYVIIGAIVCAALFFIALIIFQIRRMKSKKNKKPVATTTIVLPVKDDGDKTKIGIGKKESDQKLIRNAVTKKDETEAKQPTETKAIKHSRKSNETSSTPNSAIRRYVQNVLDTDAKEFMRFFKKYGKWAPEGMTTNAFNENADKNRYANVPCQDANRVLLQFPGCQTDYIHANYLGTARNALRFILTQGPLENTILSFWSMVIQCKVNFICMMCDVVELNIVKCTQYWPSEINEVMTIGEAPNLITLKNIGMSTLSPEDACINVTRVKVEWNDGEIIIQHFKWNAWPDHAAPLQIQSASNLLLAVSNSIHPIIAHCSAGIGRTGTIASIGFMMDSLEADQFVNFEDLLKAVRRSRVSSVQSREQWLFIHRVLLDYYFNKYMTFQLPENLEKKKKWIECYNIATGSV